MIMPISDIIKKPRRPERSYFVVQPIRAVAVNINPVERRAFARIPTPAGEAAKTANRGVKVTPVKKVKSIKRSRFKGREVLHQWAVKTRISSAAKTRYINHGIVKKYETKYV